jgi:phosphoglycolate phosphatase-like HAD superfamily hydrolase
MFQVAIFDLDKTLWNQKKLYPNVLEILDLLRINSVPMYIVSYNENPKYVCKKLQITRYFREIIGSAVTTSKYTLIKNLLNKHHPDINEKFVTFYDDNKNNIYDVSTNSNIQSVYIDKRGLTWDSMYELNQKRNMFSCVPNF